MKPPFYTTSHLDRFDNSGSLYNRAGANLHLNGTNSGFFDNGGNTVLNGLEIAPGGTLTNSGAIASSGAFQNSGVFTNSGSLTNTGVMNAGNITGPGTIVNDGGDFIVASGHSVTGATSYTQTAGLTRINGVLQAAAIDIQHGVLRGNGTVSGPVTVGAFGQILPGNSPGTLQIVGNLGVSGRNTLPQLSPHLGIEIASAASFGKLMVSGDAGFGSGGQVFLQFDIAPGFVPDLDDHFQWLSVGGTLSGEGSIVPTLTGLPAGWSAAVVRNAAGMRLTLDRAGAYQITGDAYDVNYGSQAIAATDVAYNRFGAPGECCSVFHNASTGTVENRGAFYNRVGAAFDNEGALVNRSAALMQNRGQFANRGSADNQGTFVNRSDGSLTNHENAVLVNSGQLVNEGAIANRTSAVLSNAGTTLVSGVIHNDGAIVNTGTFEVLPGGAVADAGLGTYEQTTGLTRVNGDLHALFMHFAAGEIRGSGTLNGAILTAGGAADVLIDAGVTVRPGDSIGRLTILGTVGMYGDIEIGIAGVADAEYDHLDIQGTVSFSGNRVSLILLNGFTPAIGDGFTWLSVFGPSPVGTDSLSFVMLLANADGSYSTWLPPADSLVRTRFVNGSFVTDIVPIPEPGTRAMWLAGLGVLALLVLRRGGTRWQSTT